MSNQFIGVQLQFDEHIASINITRQAKKMIGRNENLVDVERGR